MGDDVTRYWCDNPSSDALGARQPGDWGSNSGVSRLLAQSYDYFQYVFDKVDDGDNMVFDGSAAAQYFAVYHWHTCYDLWVEEEAMWECWDKDYTIPQDHLDALIAGGATLPIGNGNSNTVDRIREGVERFMITDINNPGASAIAQSEIPINWDFLLAGSKTDKFNHLPGGSNVLYFDGHVSFIRFGDGKWPATKWKATLYTGGA